MKNSNGLVFQLIVFAALLLALAVLLPVRSDAQTSRKPMEERKLYYPTVEMMKSRPERRDMPLRDYNVNDIEVREIESIMRGLYPGAIVYISPVVDGCPCQDGSDCTAQVWSVAETDGRSHGLMMSRIAGYWQIGPLQQWWLAWDRHNGNRRSMLRTYLDDRKTSWMDATKVWNDYMERSAALIENYPSCSTTPAL